MHDLDARGSKMKSLKEVSAEFCKSHHCHNCPECPKNGQSCMVYIMARCEDSPEELFSRLFHWDETRPAPVKTRRDLFFELFPGARTVSASVADLDLYTSKELIIPSVCAKGIFSDIKSCERDCLRCWTQPAPKQNK